MDEYVRLSSYLYTLTNVNPTTLMAPPKNVPVLFMKSTVPFILTLALLILMHPPTFESNRVSPKNVNGQRIAVITPFLLNRNKFDSESPSFMFSVKLLSKYTLNIKNKTGFSYNITHQLSMITGKLATSTRALDITWNADPPKNAWLS